VALRENLPLTRLLLNLGIATMMPFATVVAAQDCIRGREA
jgi:hypothetical protein